MERKRILFIQNTLEVYRIPFYECLHLKYGDVTVCHMGKSRNNINFKQIVLKGFAVKGFFFQKGLFKLSENFDIIVGMFDLRWPLIWLLPLFLKRKQRFYFWGIGVSTERGLDIDRAMDPLRYRIAQFAHGIVFYSDYPIEGYLNRGFELKRLFVGHNTVDCEYKVSIEERSFKKVLFFGSLNFRKRVDILIEAVDILKKRGNIDFFVEIIGDGPERHKLEAYVISKGLQANIFFRGAIYDPRQKREMFRDAICTVSPGQAGLSVLESFAHGVPFITSRRAITGGERMNIVSGKTGFFVENEVELANLLHHLTFNMDELYQLSNNCLDYYWTKRRIVDMVDGFIEAFTS